MIISQTSDVYNISTLLQVIDYAFSNPQPLLVGIRIDLGSVDHPIAGGNNYEIKMLINERLVIPYMASAVPPDMHAVSLVSRLVYVTANDILSVQIAGTPADQAVFVVLTLMDFTPVRAPDIQNISSAWVSKLRRR